MLTCLAYERAGFAAAAAVHFGVNGAITLLAVNSPQALGMSVAVLAVVAGLVLAASAPSKPTAIEPVRAHDDEPAGVRTAIGASSSSVSNSRRPAG